MPSPEKSTNGRSGAPRAPWVHRAGLAALSRLAPGAAARTAARMFMTPPRFAAPPRERAALHAGEPLEVRFGGGRLRAWRFGEGPPVLLVHGWGGRAGQMAALVPALRDAGLAPVALDAPAHGASPGRTASVPAFAEAVAAAVDAIGARAAVAHSMGAAGVGFAVSRGLRLDAAVFLAPPRTPWAFVDAFCAALELSPSVGERMVRRIERRVGVPRAELDLAAAGRGAALPLLVVHDVRDQEIPHAEGAAVAAAWPGARLLTTDGLGHRRILRDGRVAGAAAAFLAAHLARCATCGRIAALGEGDRARCEGCALAEELYDRGARALNASA